MTAMPPCDIAAVHQNLPHNLTPLYGKPASSRRTDKYKKIVLYILAADDGWLMKCSLQVYGNLLANVTLPYRISGGKGRAARCLQGFKSKMSKPRLRAARFGPARDAGKR